MVFINAKAGAGAYIPGLIWTLVRTLSLPDIKRLPHRWAWVEGQVFPTWKKVVRTDRHLRRKLVTIVRAARPFDPGLVSGPGV